MPDQIMLFIPAYRCAAQIPRVLAQLTPDVQKRLTEVLVVENRSPDDTLAAAVAAARTITGVDITVVQNRANYNLGGSHKVAFAHALKQGHDYVIVLHGDDQGSIDDLIPHIDAGRHREVDSLLGARFAQGSKLVGYSRFRTFGNLVFNLLISCVTFHGVKDMGAGLNMYRTSFLKDGFYRDFPNNLTFNVYMLYYSFWKKSPTRFFPLTWREDDQISNAKIFRQAWIILGLTVRYVFAARALFNTRTDAGRIDYACDVIHAGRKASAPSP
jgi:glycosyltransferase involved in cell wall biosynthesis